MREAMGRVGTAAAAVLLAASAAAGCGGDGSAEAEVPTAEPPTTTVAETTSTTLSAEAEVEQAVLDYNAMVIRLLQAPDPDDPELAQRATGANLDHLMAQLASRRMLDHVARPGPLYSHAVVDADVAGDRATARDCLIDDGETVAHATGEVVASGTATSLAELELELHEGAWRVASVRLLKEWDGAVACDE